MISKAPNGIERGQEVTDQISGMSGVCSGILLHMNGSILVGIQPQYPDKDEKTLWVDYYNATPKIPGRTIQVGEPDTDLGFELGQYVSDQVSSMEGYITEKLMQINGCISLLIEGEFCHRNGKISSFWFDQHRLRDCDHELDLDLSSAAGQGGAASQRGHKG